MLSMISSRELLEPGEPKVDFMSYSEAPPSARQVTARINARLGSRGSLRRPAPPASTTRGRQASPVTTSMSMLPSPVPMRTIQTPLMHARRPSFAPLTETWMPPSVSACSLPAAAGSGPQVAESISPLELAIMPSRPGRPQADGLSPCQGGDEIDGLLHAHRAWSPARICPERAR